MERAVAAEPGLMPGAMFGTFGGATVYRDRRTSSCHAPRTGPLPRGLSESSELRRWKF